MTKASADYDPKPTELACAAFRRVAAQWDLARTEPEHIGQDLPEEIDQKFCDEHEAALRAYFLTLAEDWSALSKKLQVYDDERMFDGADSDGKLFSALQRDLSILLARLSTCGRLAH